MKNFLFLLFTALPVFMIAQNVTVKITLISTEGGVHSNMNVTLVNTSTQAKFSGTTDANGKVMIQVPPNAIYDVLIPDYTAKKTITVPNAPGATMSSTMTYSMHMAADDAAFAMTAAEKKEVDDFAKGLADTTVFKGADPFTAFSETYYSNVELELKDLNNGPLTGEICTLTGRTRHKSFRATTGPNGKVMLYLPKGDIYDLSFYYHKNYENTECKYSKGTSEIKWEFEYIGTKEFARRKKAEEDRQIAEAKALAKAIADAKIQWIKDSIAAKKQWEKDSVNRIAAQKAQRERILNEPYNENEVAGVFDRNHFKNPLIICDASSNMAFIDDELQGWFKKNETSNAGAQFVFFNDGGTKNESQKTIGSTGGLYYTPSLPLDKLMVFMDNVINKSNDRDAEDSYVEALIGGMKMAKQTFGDVILMVDNHSSPRDMSLLSQVTHPVHVVVFCSIKGGCDRSFCKTDYIKIAWKTKGTLHINNTDYNDIGKLKEGDTITICTTKYKLVNGEFFQI
jgi:hypothetical protein